MEVINADTVVVAPPQQSVALQQLVQAPVAVSNVDLDDVNTLKTRKRKAQEYLGEVESKIRTDLTATTDDIDEAECFNRGCVVMMPPSQDKAHNNVSMQAIMQGINDLLASINNLQAKYHNSTAYFNEDNIIPPQIDNLSVPANFPTTVAELRGLRVGKRVTAIEDFYNLGHDGDLAARKRRVFRAYGTGLLLVPMPAHGVEQL